MREDKTEMGARIEVDPELARRLTGGLPVTVLEATPLPAPLSRLLVMARSERSEPDRPGRVSLAGVLVPTPSGAFPISSLGLGRGARARLPRSLEPMKTRWDAGALFLLDEAGEDVLVIGQGAIGQVTLSCGAWPGLVPLVGPRARARRIGGVAGAERELARFADVLAALLDAVYANRPRTRELALTLRAGEAGAEVARRVLAQLGREASGLFGRVTGSGGPAQQFRPGLAGQQGGESAFDDVGGQEAARLELETVCLGLRQPEAFHAWGARPPRGVLLYGPPGTGKTMLARALARESGATFLHVRATDVVSKWYGEAEQRLQRSFDEARRRAPAVLFFDEVDALARDRGEAHEATHRIVSAFLENMDGLQQLDGVVVLAATNRPEAVDPALMRPGRFDRLVEVPLPDRRGRRAIFEVHLRQAERKAGRPLFELPDEPGWERLLDVTTGLSGAELAEAVRRALEVRVRSGATDGAITPDELMLAAAGVARTC
ncbi:MAG: ATP-binding protein [Candidatus Dormibacteraeota bacterium]|nr:ATP-binding protein [Candidatus Dormibacteraeota bacterium]